MPSPFERGAEERVDAIESHLLAYNAPAKRQYIGIVMQSGKTRHRRIGAKRRADCLMTVRRNRDTNTAAADDNALLGLTLLKRFGQRVAVIGIIAAFF